MSATVNRPRIKRVSAKLLGERQRAANERAALYHAAEIHYRTGDDSLRLCLRSGIVVTFPRSLVIELAEASKTLLTSELRLSPGGDSLSLPSLDIDISIPGLLRDLFGFNIQRAGGMKRTAAKSAAARINGAKGGRPRKT
jgi:hypothetical protein